MKKSVPKCIAALTVAVMLTVSFSFAVADESVIDTILSVGTAQAFGPEEVSDEDLTAILRAGLAAESAINQQPWFFAAVRDREVMEQISGSGADFAPPADFDPGKGGAPAGAPAGAPGGAPGGMPAGSGTKKAGLGDSPVAIVIYMNKNTPSPDASFDCGLAAQNMYLAAASLGYGVKIVSSPTRTLNGAEHDRLCGLLGADPSYEAVAVLLIGRPEADTDLTTSASPRSDLKAKTGIIG